MDIGKCVSGYDYDDDTAARAEPHVRLRLGLPERPLQLPAGAPRRAQRRHGVAAGLRARASPETRRRRVPRRPPRRGSAGWDSRGQTGQAARAGHVSLRARDHGCGAECRTGEDYVYI